LDTYPSYRQNNNGQTVGYYFFTYTLMGDPGLQVWTKDPQPVVIDFSAEKPTGTNLIKATISFENDQPVPGAYVHVFRMVEEDEIRYGGYTDEDGRMSIVVDPLETGEYLMTVTGQNIVPVETSFEVIDQPFYASIIGVEIDDNDEGESSGNEDAFINPGETIEIGIMLSNPGEEQCEAFTATLTTTSPWVELIRNETDYAEINPGEFGAGAEPFVFRCPSDMPNGVELGFELVIQYGEERWREGINLQSVGYSFNIVDFGFENDGLEPGVIDNLIVTIENDGELDATSIRASLHCIDPKIQIRAAETFLGEIESGQQVDNNRQPFEIFAAPNSYPMCEVMFGLLLEDDEGRSDSLIIPVMIGGNAEVAPQGPTSYGYWAFDTRDTTGGMNPEYDWEAGDNRLNLNDQDDGGANNYAGMHGMSTTVNLPWDFIYFGQAYDQITISTNGWLCFGRSAQVSWNNQEMSSPLAPPAMLCPFWHDIWSGQVYTKHDEDADRFIVEWRNFNDRAGQHTFAVHLYNPEIVPTATGDGEFQFLYEAGNVNGPGRDYPEESVTIGFSSPDRKDGMTIAHARDWDPRTEDIGTDMSIRFTTGPLTEFGSIHGTVIAAEGDQPMEDVRVMLDGTGFFSLTGVNGEYVLENAPVGTYNIIAQRRYYNEAVTADIQIVVGEDVEVDFIMTYPTFNIDVEELVVPVWPDSVAETAFEVWNEGNGPLEYELILRPDNDEPDVDLAWGELFNYAVGDSVDDSGLYGLAFDGVNFYISGQLSRRDFPHMIYVFDRDGNHLEDFHQFNLDSNITRGYTTLDFNGENLVAVEQRRIIEITREGAFVDSLTTPENPTQAMTWSPTRGTFFTKSMTGRRFYELDTLGNIVTEFEYEGETNYSIGMTWFAEDPDGFNLYIFSHNRHPEEVGEGSRLALHKMNPETGEMILIRYLRFEGMSIADRPLDCIITNRWDPLMWTFIGLMNVTPTDRLVGFEISPNLAWISFDPQLGLVQPAERTNFGLSINSTGMPERDYSLVLELFHNAEGDRYNIPLSISIGEFSSLSEDVEVPSGFELSAAWPNPFNPSTKLDFQLPFESNAHFKIWDISGRLVDEINYGKLPSGSHTFEFDGSGFSSGVYIIQLNAGNLNTNRKVVLMR
ncbi:MAG: T9SS type A sorting domain-containing protein, partial [Calditrichaeota bacterium]|nr:T9SS type A sorting domain-containing protein [Calditrichota bacterium]